MPLLDVILILVVAGVVLWLVNAAPFIDAKVKKIITYLVIGLIIFWLISMFLPLESLNKIRVGHPR